jgi:hypothetical protein
MDYNTLLQETKEAMINMIPSLSDEQKKQIKDFFKIHPNYESKIDWNDWRTLTYNDFVPLLSQISKTARQKMVKNTGINGLDEGTDYIIAYNSGTIVGYCPLDWEASKMIASSYVGASKTTGKWCVALHNNRNFWDNYVSEEGDNNNRFLYLVDYNPDSTWGKIAIRMWLNLDYQAWNWKDEVIFSSMSATARYNVPNKYPNFIFNVDKMKSLIDKALVLIMDAGDARSELDKEYFIDCYIQEEIENDILKGGVSFVQLVRIGDDIEDEDTSVEGLSSSFEIQRVGEGIDNADLGFLDELTMDDGRKFATGRGRGIYIVYENDYTPDDAQKASNNLRGDITDIDDYEIKRTALRLLDPINAKKILHHLDADSSLQYSYILIKNDISIDEYLMNILGRYIKVSKCKQDTLYDSAEVSYYVYYRDDYDWETPDKYAGTDWVSTPAQRAYDHQLDLDYGF